MFGKLNMAIIGTGRMASVMAETVRKVRGVRLYAVASRDASRASEFGEQHGIKKMYGSYEELAEDSKVNFVYIATPHSEHFENAKLYALCYASNTVTIKRYRIPVFDIGLNEKLDDSTLVLEDTTVLQCSTFHF